MIRRLTWVCLAVLIVAGIGLAREKRGTLSGTWDCQAHGGKNGDMAFTLYLQQDKQEKEVVNGSVSSPIGGTDFSSATFRRNMLEIHVDTPEGPYILMAKLEKGKLEGTWSLDSDKGTWEGSKHAAPAK